MSNKISKDMISTMSKSSLKTSRLRNIFVMITIILASSLLTVILMFAAGQNEKTKRDLSHAQQVGYYNLTEQQVETLKNDERIAYQVEVKTGTVSEMNGFSVIPYYVSELSDKIRIAELESGKLPQEENEIARKDVVTNEVVLIGYICKKPIYRQTPFGREIADILLAVNRAYNKSDYIPCIAWGRNARFCQNLEVGSQIKLVGRVQSRTYEKKHDDGSVETRVAYEVSVGSLEVIEENDNENTVETENQEAV